MNGLVFAIVESTQSTCLGLPPCFNVDSTQPRDKPNDVEDVEMGVSVALYCSRLRTARNGDTSGIETWKKDLLVVLHTFENAGICGRGF